MRHSYSVKPSSPPSPHQLVDRLGGNTPFSGLVTMQISTGFTQTRSIPGKGSEGNRNWKYLALLSTWT